jgi:hypothetical protein
MAPCARPVRPWRWRGSRALAGLAWWAFGGEAHGGFSLREQSGAKPWGLFTFV